MEIQRLTFLFDLNFILSFLFSLNLSRTTGVDVSSSPRGGMAPRGFLVVRSVLGVLPHQLFPQIERPSRTLPTPACKHTHIYKTIFKVVISTEQTFACQ
jgi:hypothetical protein